MEEPKFRTILIRIKHKLSFLILKVINQCTMKGKKHLLFIPNEGGKIDHYDIENCESDNVLKLCSSILQDERFSDYHLSIMVFDESKIEQYKKYVEIMGFKGKVDFPIYDDLKQYIKAWIHSSFILTANFYRSTPYKNNKQKVFCLGYFVVPFKDDFFKIERMGYKEAMKYKKEQNRLFDYHLATSEFCARELSVDSLLYLPKYQSLGFPRNDIFFSDSKIFREKIVKTIGHNPSTIISFVPTHRDYQQKGNILYDENKVHQHSLFGEITEEQENVLYRFLEEEDIVIIAKSHPNQDMESVLGTHSQRIIYFGDLLSKCTTSLQEILAASDMLITDYSTACFDYLLTDKPAIYYFYDYEVQKASRRFFVDSISLFCAGDIVYNIYELIESIKHNLNAPNKYAERRKFLRDLLFQNTDGKSSERVKEFILKETNAPA